MHYFAAGTVFSLVIGVYAWVAKSGCWEVTGGQAGNSYYNLLVRGFQAGQFPLKREVPSGLKELADPYDPEANLPYLMVEGRSLYDISYHRGKLYLYFGITPALILFWPCHALTGHFLLHKHVVVFHCVVGFLVSAGLLWGVFRRCFAEVKAGVFWAGAVALGWASGTLLLLRPSDVYEVAVSCGYALIMVTLWAMWKVLQATRRQGWWLAGASLAYGLALGARPSLLLAGVILLIPVALSRRETVGAVGGRGKWTLLLAATGPITVIGLGLLLYNLLRFDSPFEFGQRYQLTGNRQAAAPQFSLSYLWINFRVAFLEPAHWHTQFPFANDIAALPLPKGYSTEHPFGILSNFPVVWLALAAPLVRRRRLAEMRSTLQCFLAAAAVLFAISAFTLCLHNSMNIRYEAEFLPSLVLVAILGILNLENAAAGRCVWRGITRFGWGILLAFSILFNLFATFGSYADTYAVLGRLAFANGQTERALAQFQKALALQPHNPGALTGMGTSLFQQGKASEGIKYLEEAVHRSPNFAEAQHNLGAALVREGRAAQAIGPLEEAVRLRPAYAEARHALGTALLQQGQAAKAIGHLEEALRLKPDVAEAHHNLATALFQQGRVMEATEHYEEALRLKPNDAEPRQNLAVARLQLGAGLAALSKWDEAIQQYQRVVNLMPDYAPPYESLGNALTHQGRYPEAVAYYQKALALDPNWLSTLNNLALILSTATNAAIREVAGAVRYAERLCELTTNSEAIYLDTLGVVYSEAGRFNEAVQAAQQGAKHARAAGNPALAARIESRLKYYQEGTAYHAIPTETEP